MIGSHVLVIHSEPAAGELVAAAAGREDVRVSLAANPAEGLAVLKTDQVHLLVADWNTLRTGHEFVRQAAAIHPLLRVVLIADGGELDHIDREAGAGEVQYLRRPVTRHALWSAIDKGLRRPPAAAGTAGGDCVPSPLGRRIVAASKSMRDLLALVRRCAPTEATVLICGEPDTGKELLVREIHRQSRRAAGPLVRVSCGGLREPELAARLLGGRAQGILGHEEPAAPPLLAQARGGTLFLENVSQLPLRLQADLLEALQQRMLAPRAEGGAADARLIASTTDDLRQAAARGEFLPSLFYALGVVEMHVPALRDRRQDIAPLAEMYLDAANDSRVARGDRCRCRFSTEAVECLLEYDWPGNAAQLASVVTHAALLADAEEISRQEVADLLGEAAPPRGADTISVPLVGGLREMERSIIGAVIERCSGNKAAAARALGLHRRTLYRILQHDPGSSKVPAPLALALDASTDGIAADAFV